MKRGGILALVGLGLGGAYLWSRRSSAAASASNGSTGPTSTTGSAHGTEDFLLFLALCQRPDNLTMEQQEALIEKARPMLREEFGGAVPQQAVDADQLSAVLGNVAFRLVQNCHKNTQAYNMAKVLANEAWLRESGIHL